MAWCRGGRLDSDDRVVGGVGQCVEEFAGPPPHVLVVGLHDPIMAFARSGAPILGTCAGMIIVAKEIAGGEEPVFPLLDVTVRRNAFGRQLDSFETELPMPIVGDRPVHAIFIRAPIIERVGPGVEVLARLPDDRVVAVRQRNVIAIAFHPELAGETRIHHLVATMAAEWSNPGEGTGERRLAGEAM